MHKITLLILLVLIIPDIYIYFLHIRPCTYKRYFKWAYILPTVILLAIYGYFTCIGGENMLAHHASGIGRFAIGVLLVSVPKIIFILFSLLGFITRVICKRCPLRYFTHVGIFFSLGIFFCLLYGATIGVRNFEVKEVSISLPDIPDGFNGYRILQLSDLHLGSWSTEKGTIEKLIHLVNEQHADVILFTGDLVNQRSHELEGFTEMLSTLKANDGVYSVLGNHDYGDYYRWPTKEMKEENLKRLKQMQADMGWKLLNNEHVILHHQGDSIALIGVENDGEPPFPQYADLKHASKGTEQLYTVLMSHNPTHWRREVLNESHIQLMLSGHTHAMQSTLFGRSLAELKYDEWRGLYKQDNRALYVNIGIGYVGLPFRFMANPEVTVITLCKQ